MKNETEEALYSLKMHEELEISESCYIHNK